MNNQRPSKRMERITAEGLRFLKSTNKEVRTKAVRKHFGYFIAYYLSHYVRSEFAEFAPQFSSAKVAQFTSMDLPDGEGEWLRSWGEASR